MKRYSLILCYPLAITGLMGFTHAVNAQEDPLVAVTANANFDNSVPAILNYAQQAQNNPSSGSVKVAPKSQKRVSANDKTGSPDAKYTRQQIWLTQKDATIHQLQAQLADKNAQGEIASQNEAKLTAQITALQEQFTQANQTLKAKQDELAKVSSDFTAFKDETAKKASPVDLKLAPQQQAYSIGVSLGNDVLQEITTREAQGVKVDHDAVMLGINDVFKGTLALDESTRNASLAAASKALYENLSKAETNSLKEGKLYQQNFAKQKGVEFKDGVYSRIDYAGQGAIDAKDTVIVVMKETLTDGTVISDMEAAGKEWSQPLEAYPPVFSGPIKRLGNHGSITVVIPAELAYGSKGLPPKVPPGATMTYNIRVVDVLKK
ncbi:FKBP-type peptidyl-prolyl cis-trans isomerase N-terminal domain-containing protein [Buttiauxella sp.]|uniref:FKBP-type peptidyl-prolyl cis-trans isomerase N-terminal domain-containing protein n=1 Tax=Buttiauxella sp. TaxID=1972222 RepID=UPI003C727131